ncbi:unnamed protein product [Mycena citricolor]|uniref:Rrn7/TAF1B C-terminal cyclin domain-containing protein n=1 Tax=Mycena citricolor TaxID=2018698 RepID=A0AAD2HIM8_9AGAR|nr:unnamed protein product [Mycena citricolor]
MSTHLSRHMRQALSPLKSPTALTLHQTASSLSRRIYASFGIRTPAANAAPILWRTVSQCLGGTATLYRLSKRLAAVLSLPLVLHRSLAPKLTQFKAWDPATHRFDSVAPEVAFLATSVIVLKMVYGLDTKTRAACDSADPAADMPCEEDFLALLKKLGEADASCADFDSTRKIHFEDLDVDAIDDYLAFCDRALSGPTKEQDVLDRFFPLQGLSKPARIIAPVMSQPRLALVRADHQTLRPGEEYALHHSDSTEECSALIERVATWSGFGEPHFSAVLQTYERQLWRWWKQTRRGDPEDEKAHSPEE